MSQVHLDSQGKWREGPIADLISKILKPKLESKQSQGGANIVGYLFDMKINLSKGHHTLLKRELDAMGMGRHPAWVNIWDPAPFSEETTLEIDTSVNLFSQEYSPLRLEFRDQLLIRPYRNRDKVEIKFGIEDNSKSIGDYSTISTGYSVNELSIFMAEIDKIKRIDELTNQGDFMQKIIHLIKKPIFWVSMPNILGDIYNIDTPFGTTDS